MRMDPVKSSSSSFQFARALPHNSLFSFARVSVYIGLSLVQGTYYSTIANWYSYSVRRNTYYNVPIHIYGAFVVHHICLFMLRRKKGGQREEYGKMEAMPADRSPCMANFLLVFAFCAVRELSIAVLLSRAFPSFSLSFLFPKFACSLCFCSSLPIFGYCLGHGRFLHPCQRVNGWLGVLQSQTLPICACMLPRNKALNGRGPVVPRQWSSYANGTCSPRTRRRAFPFLLAPPAFNLSLISL